MLKLHQYLEFEQALVADICKKIGEDSFLRKLHSWLEDNNIMKSGEIIQIPGDQRLTPILKEVFIQDFIKVKTQLMEEDDKTKYIEYMIKYIKYRLEFESANKERKQEILEDFYITDKNWLDPSALMFLGPRLEFKSKLYSKINNQPLRLDSSTPDANALDGKPCRHILYNGTDHYDLLYPITVTEV